MIHWDAHSCLPLHGRASFEPVEQLRCAGVHYVSINIGMDMNPLEQVMQVIAGFRATISAHPDTFVQAHGMADIEAAHASGKIAIGFDLEGAMPLMEQPEMVSVMAALGVRQMHFAYNRNNSVAGGCHDEPMRLTALGKRMVRAVNAAGVLMDCSHTGRLCSLDIMNESAHPVVFSHANPLALVEHGRNITDEQIRSCAATGGVVCLSGVSFFLGVKQPTAQDVACHVAYVADLVGAAHVGIGLDISFEQSELDDRPTGDFDPDYWWPNSAGYARAISHARYPPVEVWLELPEALRQVGLTATEAAQVMGGNMRRVARQVWR